MTKILILGYGNPDREDDGVSWHIMVKLLKLLGREAPETYLDEFTSNDESLDFQFELQLVPEFAETIAQYDYVCFIDAHTGNVPEDICFRKVTSKYQNSPFTHHMTASTLLSIIETLYKGKTKAMLASVRGYQFGFEHTLSPMTEALAEEAAQLIFAWINELNKT